VVETAPSEVNARRAAGLRYALAAVLLLLALPATATTVVRKELGSLCAEADLVFVGTVSGVRSQWADDRQQAIETFVEFADLDWLRGGDAETLTMRFGGGQVGEVREHVVGLPVFSAGDRVVIFARTERSVSPIVGFNQGYFRVVDSPTGPVVLDVARLKSPVSGDAENSAAPKGKPAMALTDFVAMVGAQLATLPKARP
jgi:hypothetical protein